MNILLLEDNVAIARSLGEYLEAKGCNVDFAYSGRACLELVKKQSYDVLVLDISMPGLNGLDACKAIRLDMQISTPIIFLTARDTLEDKLAGFETGADDYLVKPFSPEELLCRLRALYLRGPRRDIGLQIMGELSINHSLQTVSRNGVPIKLLGVQLKILTVLAKHSPEIVPKSVLEKSVWGDDVPDSGVLRTHLYRLRNLLDKPFDRPLIKTIHGKGYQLDAE